MRVWLKVGLIVLSVSVVLIFLMRLCVLFSRLIGPRMICLPLILLFSYFFYYVIVISGLDYFVALFGIYTTPYLNFILAIFILTVFGFLLGLLLDRKISWKKKVIVFAIFFLIFIPISANSAFLKYRDKRIISELEETANFEICSKLSVFHEYKKEGCYLRAVEISPDIRICRELKIEFQDKCFVAVAISEKDLELCEGIKSDSIKGECYDALAEILGDETLCEKMVKLIKPLGVFEEAELSDETDCYIGVAKTKQDTKICDLVKSIPSQRRCYVEVSISANDPNICRNAKENSLKDFCYHGVAIKLGDETLCENIINPLIKDNCYSDIT